MDNIYLQVLCIFDKRIFFSSGFKLINYLYHKTLMKLSEDRLIKPKDADSNKLKYIMLFNPTNGECYYLMNILNL